MSEPIPCAVPRMTTARCPKPATHIVERPRGRRLGKELDPYEGARTREPACDECAAFWRRGRGPDDKVRVLRFSDIGGEVAVRAELCKGEGGEGCEDGALVERDGFCIDCHERMTDREKPSSGKAQLY